MMAVHYPLLSTIYVVLTLFIQVTTYKLVAAEQLADDVYDYNGGNDDGVVYSSFTVCDDAVITVQDVQLHCDSPGTFYYGSGRYRDSLNCTSGDKGKFLIDFYISQPATIQSNGGSAIIDVSAVGNIGWYQQNQQIIESADLCSMSSLTSLSKSVCPSEGTYRIESNFYWESANSNNNNNNYFVPTFYPVLSVGFKSGAYLNTYDYGGANTQYCSGNTFVSGWTNKVKKIYANGLENFLMSSGILLFTILIMWAFIWIMIKKPTSCKDVGVKLGLVKKGPLVVGKEDSFEEQSCDDSEKFDFSKMRSPRANQTFLDF